MNPDLELYGMSSEFYRLDALLLQKLHLVIDVTD